MFGIKRRAATKATVENIRPLVGLIQYTYGLPAGFWQDEYVIGFFGFTIGFNLKAAANGRLSDEDIGFGLSEVFTQLSNINGAEIARHYTHLAFHKSDDFKSGAENAALMCFFTYGILKDEDNYSSVREAKTFARRAGFPGDRSQAAAFLTNALFVNIIKDRFDLGERSPEENQFPYSTFDSWLSAFKVACGRYNSALAPSENGQSLIDFMEHEPLERAFHDKVYPDVVAKAFAPQFDPRTFGNRGSAARA
ncbi:hypothetical protein [Azospirillum himalayense]|uniref:Uncharacterized protein n=1 Tax=Azospirillum himalayense TaxID=654847 RepID=A0ABW0G0Y3_9PROT